MSAPDIIKRLTENAAVLKAYHGRGNAAAAATMLEAADEIVALRGKLLWPWPADDGWDVT